MNTALVSLLVLLALAAAPAKEPAKQPAPPTSDVTYTVPAGWERAEKDHVVTLTPPATAAEQCSIVLTPGEPLKGDFAGGFDEHWGKLRKGAQGVQGGERTGQPNGPNGSSYFTRAALLESPAENGAAPVRAGLLLYAVHIGDSVHTVVFRTDGPKRFNDHKKTVNRFLASLQFYDTRRERSPRPAVKPRPAEPGARN